jgi:hypothetical protein
VTELSPLIFWWLNTARCRCHLVSKQELEHYPVSISCLHKFTLAIYSDFRALVIVPERRITDEFTNVQHPLNITGVSKRRHKKRFVMNALDKL